MRGKLITVVLGFCAILLTASACRTAPKLRKQEQFMASAQETVAWFETNVNGLKQQIDKSAGYIIFPNVKQFGMMFGGGTFGRGALCRPDGTQLGWAAINRASLGLQAGVQGFRMLILFENEDVLTKFRSNKLTGSMAGQLVVVKAGGSGAAIFKNGVAVYQGANKGLMAGVSVGFDYIRHHAMETGEEQGDTR